MKGYMVAVIHCVGLDVKSDKPFLALRQFDGETMAAEQIDSKYYCYYC